MDTTSLLAQISASEDINEELATTLVGHIVALEDANDRLAKTLKFCITLLAQFEGVVPSPDQWQEMLNIFELIIHEAEALHKRKTVH